MDVQSVLERLACGVAAADGVAVDGLCVHDLRALIVGVHAAIDRLRVIEARAVHEADQQLVWLGSGARDLAGWLAEATNSSLGDATRQARLGDALAGCPELAEAVADGRMSVGAAEAVAPTVTDPTVAGEEVDGLLAGVAGASPREAKRAAEQWAAAKRSRADDDARRQHAADARHLRFHPEADGSVTGSFSLPTVDARTVRQALEHLAGPPIDGDRRSGEQRLANAFVALADAYSRGQVVGGRERPSLLVVVDADVADGSTPGNGATSFDDVVPAADLERMLCDCELHRVVRDAHSTVLDLGRATRTVSRSQWLALVARDRRCRWPGCTMPPGWCDAHHIIEWSDGGSTDLANLALLCRHHHTTVHLPGQTLTGTAGHLTITLPDGRTLHSHPPLVDRPDADQQHFAIAGAA